MKNTEKFDAPKSTLVLLLFSLVKLFGNCYYRISKQPFCFQLTGDLCQYCTYAAKKRAGLVLLHTVNKK